MKPHNAEAILLIHCIFFFPINKDKCMHCFSHNFFYLSYGFQPFSISAGFKPIPSLLWYCCFCHSAARDQWRHICILYSKLEAGLELVTLSSAFIYKLKFWNLIGCWEMWPSNVKLVNWPAALPVRKHLICRGRVSFMKGSQRCSWHPSLRWIWVLNGSW